MKHGQDLTGSAGRRAAYRILLILPPRAFQTRKIRLILPPGAFRPKTEQMLCILYAARRPADPVRSWPCFILRRFLPRASLTSAHSRLSALVASSYPESIISSRINYFIRNRLSYPACGQEARGPGGKRARGPRRQSARKPGSQGARRPGGRGPGVKAPGRQGARRPVCQGARGPACWDTKMRQKRVPLARKCVENAYP